MSTEDDKKDKEGKQDKRTEPVKREKVDQQHEMNRKKGRGKKKIGNIFQNIKGAIKGNIRDIFILKVKLFLYGMIIVFIAVGAIQMAILKKRSNDSDESISKQYSSGSVSSSGSSGSAGSSGSTEGSGESGTEGVTDPESISAVTFNTTGSLIYATTDELANIANNFFESIKNTSTGYQSIFTGKYFGRDSSTVASKVKHITTNYETGETVELEEVTDKATIMEGAASPKTERTMYEHILRTEKYNFNNIVYRNFIDGEKSGKVELVVDTTTELQYPKPDPDATNNEDLTLDYFVTKTRPYLQTRYIPYDLMLGTLDDQAGKTVNDMFGYSIVTNAYHEIVQDRYKMENLQRQTNYLVYDKTTTTTTTTRTCETWKKVLQSKGTVCSELQWKEGLCTHSVTVGCGDEKYENYCFYGYLDEDITEETTYCVDTENTVVTEEKDLRKAKVSTTAKTDTLTYSWTYVISLAKMLDRVISNEYTFEEYFEYSLENYLNFINKRGTYATMTPAEYQESEKTNSQADSMTTEEKDYYYDHTKTNDTNSDWNISSKKVDTWADVPDSAGEPNDETVESKDVIVITNIKEVGKEYIDSYEWSDTLKFSKTNSGVYNLDSVKDVTGDDLTSDDKNYYNSLYKNKELNLVDLMNSDSSIFNEYEEEPASDNIGTRRSRLDSAYYTLEDDLKDLVKEYPLSGLMYGTSLNIMEGLSLGAVVAAGSINEQILNVALSYEGKNLRYMIQEANSLGIDKVFSWDQWCAMFVSFCMRKVEKDTGIEILIPTYTACTSQGWGLYHDQPGFYDVQEWVDANPSAQYRNENPANIAPLASIQPGDIILFSWVEGDERK